MTNDGYVQELGEGEYYPAELPQVDFDHAEVDPENPGFASLLHALRGYRAGHFDGTVIEAYVVGLSPRLDAAFQQWEQVAGQPLQEMGLGEEQIAQLQGAFSATEALLQEMDVVLGLIERGLTEPDDAALDEAEQRLANVHEEIKGALG